MTMAAQAACGGSGPRHWLKLHVPAQAAIAGSSLAHRSPVFAKIHPASPKSVTSDPRCSCSRWLKLHGNSAGFRCQPIQQGPAPATGLDETTGDSLARRCSLELWCQLKFRLTAQSTKAGPSLRAPEEVKRAGTSRASLHLWQQHPLRLQPYGIGGVCNMGRVGWVVSPIRRWVGGPSVVPDLCGDNARPACEGWACTGHLGAGAHTGWNLRGHLYDVGGLSGILHSGPNRHTLLPGAC